MCRFPTEYPAVPAIQYPPLPTHCTSLMRPPVPVVAPLNGATPVGKLWVSAVKIKWDSVGTCLSSLTEPDVMGRKLRWIYPLMALKINITLLI